METFIPETPPVDAINQSINNNKKDREILERCLIFPLEIACWKSLPEGKSCPDCNLEGFTCEGDKNCINLS